MINYIKEKIYAHTKTVLNEKFPTEFPLLPSGASTNIFWGKTKSKKPTTIFVELNDNIKSKVYQRHDSYNVDLKRITKETWQIMVTFACYNTGTDSTLADAEQICSDVIEYLSHIYNDEASFLELGKYDIIIDEMQMSGIRDLSSFLQTNNQFRYEVDVFFRFEKITEENIEHGENVGIHIEVKDSDKLITMEVENVII